MDSVATTRGGARNGESLKSSQVSTTFTWFKPIKSHFFNTFGAQQSTRSVGTHLVPLAHDEMKMERWNTIRRLLPLSCRQWRVSLYPAFSILHTCISMPLGPRSFKNECKRKIVSRVEMAMPRVGGWRCSFHSSTFSPAPPRVLISLQLLPHWCQEDIDNDNRMSCEW